MSYLPSIADGPLAHRTRENEMNIEDRLNALIAMPKPWHVVTLYECGKVRHLACITRAAAETHADMEQRKVGRDLIERETGRKVKVVSVEILHEDKLN